MEEQNKPTPVIGEYQGKPMIILNPGDRFLVQFGINKSKIILDNIDYIRKFVETDGKGIE